MVSPEDVVMAYRLLLGREPENPTVVEHYSKSSPTLDTLRQRFLASDEFNNARFPRLPAVLDQGSPLRVEVDIDPVPLQRLFARIEDTWEALGKSEPFWSVLSSDQFRRERFQQNAASFYESGRGDVNRLISWLRRNEITMFGPNHTCCEYGCGTGRTTRWLAPHFSRVLAYDISGPHIQIAQDYLKHEGISNVSFQRIDSLGALNSMEPVDLVFSVIVLQHNPPPIIAFILEKLLRSLKPRGLAFFQIPTYTPGYEFIAEKYLRQPASREIEVHLLQQRRVFAIAERTDCSVLEVQPDSHLGLPLWISTTFLLRKRAA